MTLRLLHYSDVENAGDDPERLGRLAGLIDHLRDEDTLVFGTGDNTAPGVLSLVTGGAQGLDFFRAVEPDAGTFGNHDFDHGLDRTRELVRESPQTWVSANVRLDGERFGREVGVVPTATFDRAGRRVGVFGVLDDQTPGLNPEAGALTVTDPIGAAERAIRLLRGRGADVIVALSHLGRGDERLAVETDVDVILGGHVHSERIERVGGAVLTRPGANGHALLSVRIEGANVDVERHEVTAGSLDDDLAGRIRDRLAATGLDDPVAEVADPILRTEATAYRGESRVGNLVADAYRWAADADVGLQNAGGIREGPALAGTVTVADLVSVVPFEEPVSVAELRGRDLRALLEQASGAAVGFGEPEWWHAHVSGLELVWDEAARELVAARVGGEPLDPDATYTLATTDYLFTSPHEFPALTTDHRVESLDVQYRVLAAYAREFGLDPAVEGRIVRRGADR